MSVTSLGESCHPLAHRDPLASTLNRPRGPAKFGPRRELALLLNFESGISDRRRAERGELWQARFFDRALRSVKEYNDKVEYIHLNAVKAGLAERPEDWPWSSVREYSGSIQEEAMRHPFLPIRRVLLPSGERTRI
jgi:hypothetical protein